MEDVWLNAWSSTDDSSSSSPSTAKPSSSPTRSFAAANLAPSWGADDGSNVWGSSADTLGNGEAEVIPMERSAQARAADEEDEENPYGLLSPARSDQGASADHVLDGGWGSSLDDSPLLAERPPDPSGKVDDLQASVTGLSMASVDSAWSQSYSSPASPVKLRDEQSTLSTGTEAGTEPYVSAKRSTTDLGGWASLGAAGPSVWGGAPSSPEMAKTADLPTPSGTDDTTIGEDKEVASKPTAMTVASPQGETSPTISRTLAIASLPVPAALGSSSAGAWGGTGSEDGGWGSVSAVGAPLGDAGFAEVNGGVGVSTWDGAETSERNEMVEEEAGNAGDAWAQESQARAFTRKPLPHDFLDTMSAKSREFIRVDLPAPQISSFRQAGMDEISTIADMFSPAASSTSEDEENLRTLYALFSRPPPKLLNESGLVVSASALWTENMSPATYSHVQEAMKRTELQGKVWGAPLATATASVASGAASRKAGAGWKMMGVAAGRMGAHGRHGSESWTYDSQGAPASVDLQTDRKALQGQSFDISSLNPAERMQATGKALLGMLGGIAGPRAMEIVDGSLGEDDPDLFDDTSNGARATRAGPSTATKARPLSAGETPARSPFPSLFSTFSSSSSSVAPSVQPPDLISTVPQPTTSAAPASQQSGSAVSRFLGRLRKPTANKADGNVTFSEGDLDFLDTTSPSDSSAGFDGNAGAADAGQDWEEFFSASSPGMGVANANAVSTASTAVPRAMTKDHPSAAPVVPVLAPPPSSSASTVPPRIASPQATSRPTSVPTGSQKMTGNGGAGLGLDDLDDLLSDGKAPAFASSAATTSRPSSQILSFGALRSQSTSTGEPPRADGSTNAGLSIPRAGEKDAASSPLHSATDEFFPIASIYNPAQPPMSDAPGMSLTDSRNVVVTGGREQRRGGHSRQDSLIKGRYRGRTSLDAESVTQPTLGPRGTLAPNNMSSYGLSPLGRRYDGLDGSKETGVSDEEREGDGFGGYKSNRTSPMVQNFANIGNLLPHLGIGGGGSKNYVGAKDSLFIGRGREEQDDGWGGFEDASTALGVGGGSGQSGGQGGTGKRDEGGEEEEDEYDWGWSAVPSHRQSASVGPAGSSSSSQDFRFAPPPLSAPPSSKRPTAKATVSAKRLSAHLPPPPTSSPSTPTVPTTRPPPSQPVVPLVPPPPGPSSTTIRPLSPPAASSARSASLSPAPPPPVADDLNALFGDFAFASPAASATGSAVQRKPVVTSPAPASSSTQTQTQTQTVGGKATGGGGLSAADLSFFDSL